MNINLVTTEYSQLNSANLRPGGYITTAINLLFGLAGVAAFLYLLWGGFKWITAGGDKDALDKSRRVILNALTGLAVTFSAYAFLFIIQALFGISLIGFNIRPIGS